MPQTKRLRERMDITVERKPYGLLLSTIYGCFYYKHKYAGCTVREAKREFRQYVRDEDAKIIRGT